MIERAFFSDRLRRDGGAWRAGDPRAVLLLFTDDAAYHETSIDPPLLGRVSIGRYWTEGARDGQRDVTFAAQPVGVNGDTGCALWRAIFVRQPAGSFVELDGVRLARFAADGRCLEFRQWWHRRETPARR